MVRGATTLVPRPLEEAPWLLAGWFEGNGFGVNDKGGGNLLVPGNGWNMHTLMDVMGSLISAYLVNSLIH